MASQSGSAEKAGDRSEPSHSGFLRWPVVMEPGLTFVRDSEYLNVFCFADRDQAQRFEKEFVGAMIAPKDRPRWPSKPARRR
jgi:hypothetical protein